MFFPLFYASWGERLEEWSFLNYSLLLVPVLCRLNACARFKFFSFIIRWQWLAPCVKWTNLLALLPAWSSGNLSRVETQGEEQGISPTYTVYALTVSPMSSWPEQFWLWSNTHLRQIWPMAEPHQLSSKERSFFSHGSWNHSPHARQANTHLITAHSELKERLLSLCLSLYLSAWVNLSAAFPFKF